MCLRIIRGSFVSEETNKVLVRINLYHIWKMRCKYEKHSVAVMQCYFYIYLDFVDIFC